MRQRPPMPPIRDARRSPASTWAARRRTAKSCPRPPRGGGAGPRSRESGTQTPRQSAGRGSTPPPSRSPPASRAGSDAARSSQAPGSRPRGSPAGMKAMDTLNDIHGSPMGRGARARTRAWRPSGGNGECSNRGIGLGALGAEDHAVLGSEKAGGRACREGPRVGPSLGIEQPVEPVRDPEESGDGPVHRAADRGRTAVPGLAAPRRDREAGPVLRGDHEQGGRDGGRAGVPELWRKEDVGRRTDELQVGGGG